jgi:hypothetical protein
MLTSGAWRLITLNSKICSDFKIQVQHDFEKSAITLPDAYDVGFIMNPLDDRGSYSSNLVKNNTNRVLEIEYDNDSLKISIDHTKVRLREFKQYKEFDNYNSFLFDTTNLSFAEILILLRKIFLLDKPCDVGFVYTQPLEYKQKYSTPNETHSFTLSSTINKVDLIPGFNNITSRDNAFLLAFLGFEESRLSRTLNPDEGNSYVQFAPVFCVPPFLTGWETHSLMAHSRVFEEYPPYEVYFSSAFGLMSSYNKIMQIKRQLGSRPLVLAPYGPKPSSIGVALAAAQNKDLNIVYDFPKRIQGRSSGIGITNYIKLSLNDR